MVRIYRRDGRGSDIKSLSHLSHSDITASVSQRPVVADNHWNTTHLHGDQQNYMGTDGSDARVETCGVAGVCYYRQF